MYIKRLNQQKCRQCHFQKRNKSHASKSCQGLRNTLRTGLPGHEQHLEGDSLWAPEWKGAVGRGNSLVKCTAWYRGINEHQTADMGESVTKGKQPLMPFMPDSSATYCVKINLTPTHLSERKVNIHTQHHTQLQPGSDTAPSMKQVPNKCRWRW